MKNQNKVIDELKKENEQKAFQLATIVEYSDDAIISKTLDGIITSWNNGAEKIYGYSESEMIGKSISILVPAESSEEVLQILKKVKNGEHVDYFETIRQRKDGQRIHIALTTSPIKDSHGRVVAASTIARDVTERKRNSEINASRLYLMQYVTTHSLDELLEETLNEAEKLTGSLIGFYHFVEDDQVSLTLQNWSSRTKAEFCKAEGKGMHYPIDNAGVWVECVAQRKPVIHNDYASLPNRKGLPEGHATVIRELVVPVLRGEKIMAILGVGNKATDYTEKDIEAISLLADLAWEIAERKRTDEALVESEKKYRTLIQKIQAAIIVHGADTQITTCNRKSQELLGLSEDQLLGRTMYSPDWHFLREDGSIMPLEEYPANRVMATRKELRNYIAGIHRPNNDCDVWVLVNADPVFSHKKEIVQVIVTFYDITELKKLESEQARINRALRMLGDCNQALIHIKDESALLKEICNVVVKTGGYRLAWVGYAEKDKAKTLRPVAYAGTDSDYIESVRVSWADDEYGRGPGGMAIRTGKTCIVRNIPTDPTFAPWRDAAVKRGYNSIIALPLMNNDLTFGALGIYSVDREPFDMHEVEILEELVNDLAFGIDALRTREKHKQAEEALGIREREYRSLAESSPDNIIRYDRQCRAIYCNPVMSKTFSSDPEMLLGKTPIEFGGGGIENDTEYERNIRRVLEVGCTSDMELILQQPDGRLHHHLIRFAAERDMEGNIIGVLAIGRDITEIKQAEESLRASEERYRLIAENTMDTIVVMDLELNIVYVSPSIQKLRGYTAQEAMSQTIDQILTPKSLQKVKKVFAEQLEAEAEKNSDPGRFVLLELEEIHKNGSVIQVEISVSVIRDDKLNPVQLLVVTRDISKRKQAEEKLKVLSHAVEQNPIMILITDTEGNIEFANPKFEEVTGYSMTEVIGKNPSIVKSGKMPGELYKDLWDTIKANNVWQGELINKKKNGEFFWANLSVSPIIDAEGNATHYVGIQEDISGRKIIEEELIHAKERAEESDRLKSAFLANMSHEIRTPMNGILGFAELLKNPELTGEQQNAYIKIIEKAGARMLNIINDILSISRIESGLVEVYSRETIINEQTEQVFHLLKPDADSKRIKFSFSNGLPANESIVKTDSQKLYSILTNLVKNAIKYTDKGSVEFGYTKKGNYLEFYVKDTGIGIPKIRQKAIFERFIQADIEDKMARQGAGLGLSISLAYAEMLGGKIWLKSEPGSGSTFYFKLPYNYISKKTNESKNDSMTDEERRMTNPENSGLKILIAENDETSERLISIQVNKLSREIIAVTTGVEAIETCRRNPDIDLILMDIQMPDLNGYEATRQIRQFNKKIVIIAQTAYALAGEREKAIKEGCNDYISKPFSGSELVELIKKHTRK